MPYTEANYENAIIELMRDTLGYTHVYGPSVKRDYHFPIYEDLLQSFLANINPKLPQQAIAEAIFKLKNYDSAQLLRKNEQFMDYLQNGVEVSVAIGGQQKNFRVRLIDYEQINNNEYTVVNQWTVVENEEKRPDIVVFINGLPLVVMELKSILRGDADVSSAYRQIRNYLQDIPSLFTYNAFCIISDQRVTKVDTITAKEDRFMEWKTVNGDYEATRFADFSVLIEGMLQKERLLDIIKHFILFSKSSDGDAKILAGYHQYFAVNKAMATTAQATRADGRGGIFWHTQGSGKSLSMVFLANLLQSAVDSPTIVVIRVC